MQSNFFSQNLFLSYCKQRCSNFIEFGENWCRMYAVLVISNNKILESSICGVLSPYPITIRTGSYYKSAPYSLFIAAVVC